MFQQIPPVTLVLLILNVAFYLLLGPASFDTFALWPLGSPDLPPYSAFHPWQLITYAFLHDPRSIAHLFFNMFALFMFGPEIERLFGSRRFAIYYFTCVIGAAVAQLIVLNFMAGPPFPTVGASGGVFGILLAFGMAFPKRKLIVIPIPVPMPAWLLVTLYGAVELFLGVTGTQQGVAHFAHLGGMAAGFGLIQIWKRHRL